MKQFNFVKNMNHALAYQTQGIVIDIVSSTYKKWCWSRLNPNEYHENSDPNYLTFIVYRTMRHGTI